MPAFPGTVRVAGTLSATDGAVIVTEDRLSLHAGEDSLGNWSLDTLDIAYKGQAITIAIDNEVVVFMTDDADRLAIAVEEGARLAAKTAEARNQRIKQSRRPRIGRKASTKRKIEIFDEEQRSAVATQSFGAATEPGADPWIRGVEAPVLNPPEPPPAPPGPAEAEAPSRAERRAARRAERRAATTVESEDRRAQTAARRERASRIRQLGPPAWAAAAGVAALIVLGAFFPVVVSTVVLAIAAVTIMVAIAGMMDQAIELRLPAALSVSRLFVAGIVLLVAGALLGSFG